MPRNDDPKSIKVGTGKANQNSVDANSFTRELSEGIGGSKALEAHINDESAAHPASAITTTGTDGLYDYMNVQGNLDELAGLIPPRPPTVGNFRTNQNTVVTGLSGVPDWGLLKLEDAGLVQRGLITTPNPEMPNPDADIYPYFYFLVPEVASFDPPFNPVGNDPASDPTFNLDPAGTGDPSYKGGGPGLCHYGGFTRSPAGPGAVGPIIEGVRIIPSGGGAFTPVVVSGLLYPGDRGVLALLHWPAGGNTPQFLAQPLTNRCVAAILLGQGINDSGADCDGDAGGIFTEGDPTIFGYPGRASGQYQLRELHTGLVEGTGAPLPAPFDVGDPSAGQVRLGSDPEAGVPVVPGGIPILGGTLAATGGGNDNNYFRYRLPYLIDYTTTGLPFTPADEKFRYFNKPLVAVDHLVDLTQAGDYPNLTKNYWQFQVSRYRHLFELQLNTPLPPDPIDQGSYLLVHFERETDFEAYVRDGVLPDDPMMGYEVYSSRMLDYADPENVDNLVNPTTLETSTGYHPNRAAIFEDPSPNTTITGVTATYDFARTVDEVMRVSGVAYFVPSQPLSPSAWVINATDLQVDGLWAYNYYLGNKMPPAQQTPGLGGQNPLFIFYGLFTSKVPGAPAGVPFFNSSSESQRLEFDYAALDAASLHGPFDLTNGPIASDAALLQLTPADPSTLSIFGSIDDPRFSGDARIRAFARKPLGHADPATTVVPVLFDRPGAAAILFHSTSMYPAGGVGEYGNFVTGPFPSPARPTLETPQKDYEERFLDEVYRYSNVQINSGLGDPTYDILMMKGNLAGPGLPFPSSSGIDVPVRIGTTAGAFLPASYLQNGLYEQNLGSDPAVNIEAQAVGLPDRNPPLEEGVTAPVPSSGALIYPHKNYGIGYRPSVADGDVTTPQPDYSPGGLGAAIPRLYLRAFDVGRSRSATSYVAQVSGQPFFRLRIGGLNLADFAYAPVGPGSLDVAVQIKVPGLTTWMDAGRADGSGPSKQDALADGAGCKILNPTKTFDFFDSQTGYRGCNLEINVGPATNLYTNSDGEVPVWIRVTMRPSSFPNYYLGDGSPDDRSGDVAGLLGIEVLPPFDIG